MDLFLLGNSQNGETLPPATPKMFFLLTFFENGKMEKMKKNLDFVLNYLIFKMCFFDIFGGVQWTKITSE